MGSARFSSAQSRFSLGRGSSFGPIVSSVPTTPRESIHHAQRYPSSVVKSERMTPRSALRKARLCFNRPPAVLAVTTNVHQCLDGVPV